MSSSRQTSSPSAAPTATVSPRSVFTIRMSDSAPSAPHTAGLAWVPDTSDCSHRTVPSDRSTPNSGPAQDRHHPPAVRQLRHGGGGGDLLRIELARQPRLPPDVPVRRVQRTQHAVPVKLDDGVSRHRGRAGLGEAGDGGVPFGTPQQFAGLRVERVQQFAAGELFLAAFQALGPPVLLVGVRFGGGQHRFLFVGQPGVLRRGEFDALPFDPPGDRHEHPPVRHHRTGPATPEAARHLRDPQRRQAFGRGVGAQRRRAVVRPKRRRPAATGAAPLRPVVGVEGEGKKEERDEGEGARHVEAGRGGGVRKSIESKPGSPRCVPDLRSVQGRIDGGQAVPDANGHSHPIPAFASGTA